MNNYSIWDFDFLTLNIFRINIYSKDIQSQKIKDFCGVDFQKTDIELFQIRFSSMDKNRSQEDNESIFVGLEYTEAPERIEPISVPRSWESVTWYRKARH